MWYADMAVSFAATSIALKTLLPKREILGENFR